MIQSQMVTPPLAAMEGTTLRLKTATTKRRTRSRRPRARMSLVWAGWAAVDNLFLRPKADSSPGFARFGMTKIFLLPVRNEQNYFCCQRGQPRAAVPT